MKKAFLTLMMWCVVLTIGAQQLETSPWNGKRVAYLGDSMTDPNNNAADHKYWNCLQETLGMEPFVFAVSGFQWRHMLTMAQKLNNERGQDIDAIFIWCGTNDYNSSLPIGQFYTEDEQTVNVNGQMLSRKHRTLSMDEGTYCGNINRALSYLKSTFPTQQIIILTPIHRGYANFGKTNVQPDEDYANGQGLYIEDYVNVLKQGAQLWAIPVIDLFQTSGLYPNLQSQNALIANTETDRLHPSNEGHRRIAETIAAALRSLSPLSK